MILLRPLSLAARRQQVCDPTHLREVVGRSIVLFAMLPEICNLRAWVNRVPAGQSRASTSPWALTSARFGFLGSFSLTSTGTEVSPTMGIMPIRASSFLLNST